MSALAILEFKENVQPIVKQIKLSNAKIAKKLSTLFVV